VGGALLAVDVGAGFHRRPAQRRRAVGFVAGRRAD
jgi:hypothetical protein